MTDTPKAIAHAGLVAMAAVDLANAIGRDNPASLESAQRCLAHMRAHLDTIEAALNAAEQEEAAA